MDLLVGMPLAFDNAARDLTVVADRLDVVWGEGWWPAKPDHDRPGNQTPVEHDQVPGQKWDCGLASYPARQAWRLIAHHLAVAHDTSRTLLALLSHREPAHTALGAFADPATVRLHLLGLRGRLRGLHTFYAAYHPSEPTAKWVEEGLMGRPGHPIGSPCWHIEQARHQATSVVAIVGQGRRPPVCGRCRKAGTVGDPRRKGWCTACYKRWFRECSPTTRAGRSA